MFDLNMNIWQKVRLRLRRINYTKFKLKMQKQKCNLTTEFFLSPVNLIIIFSTVIKVL